MSNMAAWIAAEGSGIKEEVFSPQRTQRYTEVEIRNRHLPAHTFIAHSLPSHPVSAEGSERGVEQPVTEELQYSQVSQKWRDPSAGSGQALGHPELESWEYERERRIYRRRTVTMLRRYMRYSLETGRLPSLVGREFFRSNVTKYRVTTFEDRVIFVHDMERCLARLDEFAREVLARIVLQEYEHEEVAVMFGCTRMTVHRKLLESLDQLSEILLEVKLLDDLAPQEKKSCQGVKTDDFSLNDCAVGK